MKCNTRSSTETELLSLHDKLPDIVWTRYFVECQGYDIDECVVFQDNMRALLLEKNGRISSSKQTKHIKAKYFLVKDYYESGESGEIDLPYCPTDIMWADVLTKPLQGQKFRDMQAILQNCPRDYDDDIELQNNPLARQTMNHQVTTNVWLWECVGEHSKVKTAKNVPVHFSKLPDDSHKFQQNQSGPPKMYQYILDQKWDVPLRLPKMYQYILCQKVRPSKIYQYILDQK